jgi:DNA adenine methylase
MPKIISPIKGFGYKSYLQKRIISCMEIKPILADIFCGGGNIFLNYPAVTRYAFDIDPEIINIWVAIRDRPLDLQSYLKEFIYAESTFKFALDSLYLIRNNLSYDGDIYQAVLSLIINRMSRGADGKFFGWSDRLRRGKPEYISAWETMIDSIPYISKLIQGCIFDCIDWRAGIAKYDLATNKDVVFYIDPPYLSDTRVAKKVYKYEMNEEDHINLLDYLTIGWLSGTTYLSGYNSLLYRQALGEPTWKWQYKSSACQNKKKSIKTECLWKIN